MSKYILVYKTKSDWANLSKEQIVKMMEAWGEWLGSMGSAVVDKGDAFKAGGKEVSAQGISDTDNHTTGYTLIEARDFDQALGLAKGSPSIAGGGSVEVYEAFGM